MANSTSTTFESLESSIQHLIATWERRRRWQLILFLFCQPRQEEDTTYQQQQNAITTKARWRIDLAEFLNSLPVHIATILLLLVDLALTVVDLSSSLLSCHIRNEAATDTDEIYRFIGLAILSLLSAKVAALAIALGAVFFTSAGHVVDALVVVGALVLELAAEGKGAGILVVASLWRVVRVAESAFEISGEAIEVQIEAVLVQFEVVRAENRRLEEALVDKDERIKQLEEELAS